MKDRIRSPYEGIPHYSGAKPDPIPEEEAYKDALPCAMIRIHLFPNTNTFNGAHWARKVRRLLHDKSFSDLEIYVDTHGQMIIAVRAQKLIIEGLMRKRDSPFSHKAFCSHIVDLPCESCGLVPVIATEMTRQQRRNKNRRLNRKDRRQNGKKK